MKTLLLCALLTLTAAKPRQNSVEPEEVVDDYHFEYHNPLVTDDGLELFESDMLLTDEQRDGRQAVSNLWDGPVSFAIGADSEENRPYIMAGIQHWRDNTCIEFIEVPEGSSETHIHVKQASGCWSKVGKSSKPGGQPLSIGRRCTGLSTVVHEFGHALGLKHQQNRFDRDNYVTILFENIEEGKEGNFNKMSAPNNYSVPYDLTSTMHYGSTYFSVNGEDTIRAVNFLQAGLIGRRGPDEGLSHRDKQIANAMYNCAASCSSPPTCQNGGFVDKTCTCVCPPNTSGDNCETLTGDYYPEIDCGDVDMTTEGTIMTPNYPENYPEQVMCWWVIKAPAGQRVELTITGMKLAGRTGNGYCTFDYLALRYTGDVHVNDVKACDEELLNQSFTSIGSQFIVQFKGRYGRKPGFSADVKFV